MDTKSLTRIVESYNEIFVSTKSLRLAWLKSLSVMRERDEDRRFPELGSVCLDDFTVGLRGNRGAREGGPSGPSWCRWPVPRLVSSWRRFVLLPKNLRPPKARPKSRWWVLGTSCSGLLGVCVSLVSACQGARGPRGVRLIAAPPPAGEGPRGLLPAPPPPVTAYGPRAPWVARFLPTPQGISASREPRTVCRGARPPGPPLPDRLTGVLPWGSSPDPATAKGHSPAPAGRAQRHPSNEHSGGFGPFGASLLTLVRHPRPSECGSPTAGGPLLWGTFSFSRAGVVEGWPSAPSSVGEGRGCEWYISHFPSGSSFSVSISTSRKCFHRTTPSIMVGGDSRRVWGTAS